VTENLDVSAGGGEEEGNGCLFSSRQFGMGAPGGVECARMFMFKGPLTLLLLWYVTNQDQGMILRSGSHFPSHVLIFSLSDDHQRLLNLTTSQQCSLLQTMKMSSKEVHNTNVRCIDIVYVRTSH
jgi:hypothetical protein